MGASLTKNYEIEENNEYEGETFSYLASETI